jgi:hypothetical protein
MNALPTSPAAARRPPSCGRGWVFCLPSFAGRAERSERARSAMRGMAFGLTGFQ